MIHPLAGVLSAYGMGLADVNVLREESCGLPLGGDLSRINVLAGTAADALATQQLPLAATTMLRRASLRYDGSDSALQRCVGRNSPADSPGRSMPLGAPKPKSRT